MKHIGRINGEPFQTPGRMGDDSHPSLASVFVNNGRVRISVGQSGGESEFSVDETIALASLLTAAAKRIARDGPA
jgi:hypothetical protein